MISVRETSTQEPEQPHRLQDEKNVDHRDRLKEGKMLQQKNEFHAHRIQQLGVEYESLRVTL